MDANAQNVQAPAQNVNVETDSKVDDFKLPKYPQDGYEEWRYGVVLAFIERCPKAEEAVQIIQKVCASGIQPETVLFSGRK